MNKTIVSINFPANPTRFQRLMGKLLLGITWTTEIVQSEEVEE